MVCNSALPKGHPQQHVENLDRANFIRSACPGMDLNKCVMQLAATTEVQNISKHVFGCLAHWNRPCAVSAATENCPVTAI